MLLPEFSHRLPVLMSPHVFPHLALTVDDFRNSSLVLSFVYCKGVQTYRRNLSSGDRQT